MLNRYCSLSIIIVLILSSRAMAEIIDKFSSHTRLKPEKDVALIIPNTLYLCIGNNLGNEKKNYSFGSTMVLQNHFISYNSSMQIKKVKGNKTVYWKRAGIYGIEFLGAGIGTAVSFGHSIIVGFQGDYFSYSRSIFTFVIDNMLLSSSGCWLMGKILGQKGTWWKASLGASIGCLIGVPTSILLAKRYPEGFMNGIALGILLSTPSIGAVVGFNL